MCIENGPLLQPQGINCDKSKQLCSFNSPLPGDMLPSKGQWGLSSGQLKALEKHNL